MKIYNKGLTEIFSNILGVSAILIFFIGLFPSPVDVFENINFRFVFVIIFIAAVGIGAIFAVSVVMMVDLWWIDVEMISILNLVNFVVVDDLNNFGDFIIMHFA